jgi:pimeloyl-ACP methyl ester carboxylesterase
MADRRWVWRLAVAGAGLAGAGVAGGVAAGRVVVHRLRNQPDAVAETELAEPEGVEERWVTASDGAQLRVLERSAEGAGRGTVMLLHGVALSAAIWRYQLHSLVDAGFRVVAIDQRGHGASTVGSDGLSIERLADDVVEVLKGLDLYDVVLVGHSLGGIVALELAARDPTADGRIGALALVATAANPVSGSGIPGARTLALSARPVLSGGAWVAARFPALALGARDVTYLGARLVFGDEPSPRHVAFTQTVSAATPAWVVAALLDDILRFDCSDALPGLALPVTVVAGDADRLTPARHAEAVAAAIPGAELLVLPGCGHMVMLERHDELDAAIIDLAARTGSLEAVES